MRAVRQGSCSQHELQVTHGRALLGWRSVACSERPARCLGAPSARADRHWLVHAVLTRAECGSGAGASGVVCEPLRGPALRRAGPALWPPDRLVSWQPCGLLGLPRDPTNTRGPMPETMP